MDTAALFSAVISQTPYLMFSLLGLGMVLLGSTGKFGKSEIDQKDRVTFKKVGWVIFWMFLTLAVVEIIFPGKTKEFATFIAITFTFQSTLIALLVTGFVFGLIYFGIPYLKEAITEKGYKVQAIPVPDPENKEIHIQIENVGKGNFKCAARLVKITQKIKAGKDEVIKISDVYPNSPYLGWTHGLQHEILHAEQPETITLLTGSTHSSPSGMYGQNLVYIYEGSFIFSGYGKSKRIDYGQYTVTINFLRWNGFRYKEMIVFSETFEINSHGVKWV